MDNIKKFISKKDSGDGAAMFNALYTLLMIILMIVIIFFTLNRIVLTQVKIGVDQNLALSAMSASVLDTDQSSLAGDAVLAEEETLRSLTGYNSIFKLYKSVLYDNMSLNSDGNPKANTKYAQFIRNFKIDTLKVYLVENHKIRVRTYDNNGTYTTENYRDSDNIETPDGTPVTKTSIYAKVSFDLRGSFGGYGAVSRELTSVVSIKLDKKS